MTDRAAALVPTAITIPSSRRPQRLTSSMHREPYALDPAMRSILIIRGVLVVLIVALSVALIVRGNVVVGVLLGALACTRVVLMLRVRRRREELRRRFAQRMDSRRQRAL
jgi:Flp pilus assembly protein TadB